MISNCKGCEEELYQAYEYQQQGLYLATSMNCKMSQNIGRKGHFGLIMVNDKGKIIVQ